MNYRIFINNFIPLKGILLSLGWLIAIGAGLYCRPLPELSDSFLHSVAKNVGFRLQTIKIMGTRRLFHHQILQQIDPTANSSTLFFPINQALQQLKTHPWVSDAVITKRYPRELQIKIIEEEPYALWQLSGETVIINQDGKILLNTVEKKFRHLPLVVGGNAASRAKEIIELVRLYPKVFKKAQAYILVAERRWNLLIDSGIKIKLPERNMQASLERLQSLETKHHIFLRDITTIDCRIADQITFQLSDQAFTLQPYSTELLRPPQQQKRPS